MAIEINKSIETVENRHAFHWKLHYNCSAEKTTREKRNCVKSHKLVSNSINLCINYTDQNNRDNEQTNWWNEWTSEIETQERDWNV